MVKGKVRVVKVEGERNPADLMTKILSKGEIKVRLGLMGLRVVWSGDQGLDM